MRSTRLWLLALALASTFPAGIARLSAADAGESAEPAAEPYTNVRRLPDTVTLATLRNGLTVIVQENHVAPVATVRCYVGNTGSAFEGQYLGAGLSHVLEHVVSGGTTSRRTEKRSRRSSTASAGPRTLTPRPT